MKRILIGTALALFGLAPTIGSACEYNDATSASAGTVARLAVASAPAASKVPAPVIAKAPLARQAKQSGDKATSTVQDTRLAKVAANN
ncbi:MAG: hypothetical protein ABI533_02275 [Betaproteobacteria bacterium]